MNIIKKLTRKLELVDFWKIIKVICFIIVIIFLLYPLFTLFKRSFFDIETNRISLTNYIKLFSDKYYYESFQNSMILTVLTTIFAVFFGFILAYIITKYKIYGNTILKVLTLISLMSPPFIGAYSWILLFGIRGDVRLLLEKIGINIPSIYGMGGILIVLVLKLFPFIFLYVSGALKSIDVSLEEAAEGLGSNHIARTLKVTIPLILPTLLAGSLLVSMTTLSDFGTPLLLGRGLTTLPVLIYDEFVGELGGNSYFASAIGVIIIGIATVLFLLQRYIVNRKSYEMSALRPIEAEKLPPAKNVLAHLYCYLLVGFASIPQVTVAYYSFKNVKGSVFKPGFSLDSYRRVLDKLSIEIINTFLFSFIAICIMVLLALFISYLSVRRKSLSSSILDITIMFPYIIPGTVVGIMYAVTFNSGPIVFTGTAMILIVVFVIRRGPSVIRSSTGILYQISPSIEEASISLGVSPVKSFFKTTAILMIPGIISGALLAWVQVTSELSASIMLYVGKTRTMPVATYSEIIYARYGSAAAISTLLVVSTSLILTIFFKYTDRDIAKV